MLWGQHRKGVSLLIQKVDTMETVKALPGSGECYHLYLSVVKEYQLICAGRRF